MVCPVCLYLAALGSQLVNGEKTLGGGRAEIFLLEAQQKAGTLCEKGLMRLAGASGGGPVWCWCCPGLSGSLGELLCDGCPIDSSHLGPFHKNSNYCSPNGKDLYPLGRVHSTLSYVKP